MVLLTDFFQKTKEAGGDTTYSYMANKKCERRIYHRSIEESDLIIKIF